MDRIDRPLKDIEYRGDILRDMYGRPMIMAFDANEKGGNDGRFLHQLPKAAFIDI